TQPTNTVAGHNISAIAVQVQDQFGNLVTTDSSVATIALASGNGTLNGTTTVTLSAGSATFGALSMNQAGTFTLAVTDGALLGDTSSAFAITPDLPTHMVITNQPTNTVAG